MLAWASEAIVNVDVAVPTREPSYTLAFVVVDQVTARTAVLTRSLAAFVNINFTVDSTETIGAVALVTIDLLQADGTVSARVGGAFSDFLVAQHTRVAGGTDALKPVDLVDADSADARIVDALVHVDFALHALVSGTTRAGESVNAIQTETVVLARVT